MTISEIDSQKEAFKIHKYLSFRAKLDVRFLKASYGKDYDFSKFKALYEAPKTLDDRAIVTVLLDNHESIGDIRRSLLQQMLGHHLLQSYTYEEQHSLCRMIYHARREPELMELWRGAEVLLGDAPIAAIAKVVYRLAAIGVNIGETPVPSIRNQRLKPENDSVSLGSVRNEIIHRAFQVSCGFIPDNPHKRNVFGKDAPSACSKALENHPGDNNPIILNL